MVTVTPSGRKGELGTLHRFSVGNVASVKRQEPRPGDPSNANRRRKRVPMISIKHQVYTMPTFINQHISVSPLFSGGGLAGASLIGDIMTESASSLANPLLSFLVVEERLRTQQNLWNWASATEFEVLLPRQLSKSKGRHSSEKLTWSTYFMMEPSTPPATPPATTPPLPPQPTSPNSHSVETGSPNSLADSAADEDLPAISAALVAPNCELAGATESYLDVLNAPLAPKLNDDVLSSETSEQTADTSIAGRRTISTCSSRSFSSCNFSSCSDGGEDDDDGADGGDGNDEGNGSGDRAVNSSSDTHTTVAAAAAAADHDDHSATSSSPPESIYIPTFTSYDFQSSPDTLARSRPLFATSDLPRWLAHYASLGFHVSSLGPTLGSAWWNDQVELIARSGLANGPVPAQGAVLIEVRPGELDGLVEGWIARGMEKDGGAEGDEGDEESDEKEGEVEKKEEEHIKEREQKEKEGKHVEKRGRTEGPVVVFGRDAWWREVTHWDPDGNMIKLFEEIHVSDESDGGEDEDQSKDKGEEEEEEKQEEKQEEEKNH
ncbi:hypothetical protein QBC42DRAFT_255451 [Cladorrhinum samala]|uniref:Glyoxalase-like domain-containing protein n=1 Tax=Cladorrhinum samala TaxID=585594 RepID=A0AAV9HFE9_9PEZI|nr:hypothetical protein QBC42DRAFT_255451 [Cladorrhinum samala]